MHLIPMIPMKRNSFAVGMLLAVLFTATTSRADIIDDLIAAVLKLGKFDPRVRALTKLPDRVGDAALAAWRDGRLIAWDDWFNKLRDETLFQNNVLGPSLGRTALDWVAWSRMNPFSIPETKKGLQSLKNARDILRSLDKTCHVLGKEAYQRFVNDHRDWKKKWPEWATTLKFADVYASMEALDELKQLIYRVRTAATNVDSAIEDVSRQLDVIIGMQNDYDRKRAEQIERDLNSIARPSKPPGSLHEESRPDGPLPEGDAGGPAAITEAARARLFEEIDRWKAERDSARDWLLAESQGIDAQGSRLTKRTDEISRENISDQEAVTALRARAREYEKQIKEIEARVERESQTLRRWEAAERSAFSNEQSQIAAESDAIRSLNNVLAGITAHLDHGLCIGGVTMQQCQMHADFWNGLRRDQAQKAAEISRRLSSINGRTNALQSREAAFAVQLAGRRRQLDEFTGRLSRRLEGLKDAAIKAEEQAEIMVRQPAEPIDVKESVRGAHKDRMRRYGAHAARKAALDSMIREAEMRLSRVKNLPLRTQ